ncbi:HDOD domain-containing protein [Aquabacterium sp. J223]|uniref:HDOD domain-containing protein n=1 Tax=Aquabacterium sp. J223 TaxID=2898431 RepID=UPI0021ADBCE6|nr:HDOD domain-containing protein [Aquabacterium sp. J223]UUX96500.1 HDOD domain-containing protein [Aquabacterium sp. J223]
MLRTTAETLEGLAGREDAVDANLLGETIADDPLMALKVLVTVARLHGDRMVTSAETVTAALVVMGISPFFREFGALATVEERLAAAGPHALAGLRAVWRRSARAARFALGFAVHRLDHDAAVIHQAALLHDFAEMLLWCHAPALALAVVEQQRLRPGLRSHEAQREVLKVELADLQQSLMKAWRLPELLVRIADDRKADAPQVRNVQVAIRLARHSRDGWEHPGLADDLRDAGELLHLRPDAVLALVCGLDDDLPA